jgi:hypothetical protein
LNRNYYNKPTLALIQVMSAYILGINSLKSPETITAHIRTLAGFLVIFDL